MNLDEKLKYLMPVYKSFPFLAEKGEGNYLYDADGKKYLDFVAGIAVNSLGYSDTGLQKAINEQTAKFIHCSNLFYNMPQIELAEKLVKNSPFSRAFFCNSGTESIEAALKTVRKYGKVKKNGAYKIVAMEKSFHGRTMGSVSVTGQEKYRKNFEPLIPGVSFAEFNSIESLISKIDDETCAVILEPLQGEGGINPADKNYLKEVRALCTDKDIALIFDEVQCGSGRTGTLFAFEQFDVVPDIVCMAKGLGGGFPIGAVCVTNKLNVLEYGDHAATFGGNPVASSAALYVLKRLIDDDLLSNVRESGKYLTAMLEKLKNEFSVITEVRGIGLMQGIQLTSDPVPYITAARNRGLLLVSAGVNVIRFVPSYTITAEEIDLAYGILRSVFSD